MSLRNRFRSGAGMLGYVGVSIAFGLIGIVLRAAYSGGRMRQRAAARTVRQQAAAQRRPAVPGSAEDPDLLTRAAELIIRTQFGSASMVQRKLGINQAKADALMDVLEANGLVGPAVPGRAREVRARPDELGAVLSQLRRGQPLGKVRR